MTSCDFFYEDLDEHQRKVFNHQAKGIQTISASPGSGKTKLLTHIVCSLIVNEGSQKVDPDKIFVCTFSNRAKSHLVRSIHDLMIRYQKSSSQTNLSSSSEIEISSFLQNNVSTIHAMSCRVLNEWFVQKGIPKVNFMTEDVLRSFVRKWALQHLIILDSQTSPLTDSSSTIEESQLGKEELESLEERTGHLCRWVSRFFTLYWNPQDGRVSVDEWERQHIVQSGGGGGGTEYSIKLTHFWTRHFANLFRSIVDYCFEQHLLTFDMMITQLHHLIVSNSFFLDWISKRFTYIFVDEAQDLDFRQAQILYWMATGHQNLLMIGDPWQNLYQFRGSDPCWMTERMEVFWRQHRDELNNEVRVQKFHLPYNYRSHPEIVSFVQKITPNVQMQSKKATHFHHIPKDDNAVIMIAKHSDQLDFLNQVVLDIKSSVSSGKAIWSDWMILTRYQTSCAVIKEHLTQANIPCCDLVEQANDNNDHLVNSHNNAVHVGTMHASKALENKIVVVDFHSYVIGGSPSTTISALTNKTKQQQQQQQQNMLTKKENSALSKTPSLSFWSAPFLPNYSSFSKKINKTTTLKNSTSMIKGIADMTLQQNENQSTDTVDEHPERANIRVAISRSRDYLILGIPSDLRKIKNKDIQQIIEDLVATNKPI